MSPEEWLKRKEYCLQLDSQVKKAQETLKQIKDRRENMERVEREDLARRLLLKSIFVF